jgi:HEPN domain-containing protein
MQKHNEWLRFAQADLTSAKIMLKAEDDLVIGNILYSSQQCAEKALKAFLVFKKQEIKKTHDLVELVDTCKEIDLEFSILSSNAAELNPYVTKARYPDSYFTMPDVSVAKYAVQQATLIFDFVHNKIS